MLPLMMSYVWGQGLKLSLMETSISGLDEVTLQSHLYV